MKLLLILIVPLFFLMGCESCDLFPDNDPKNFRVIWNPNPPDQGVTHYSVYWYQTDDTTNFNLSDMSLMDTVPHSQVDSLVSPYYTIVLNYMRAGVVAHNDNGVSTMGLSRFYSYFEFEPPSVPSIRGIEKE